MENTKHTAGPWETSREHDRETITSSGINQYGNFIVTIVSRGDEPLTDEDRANARLIAAAPDLAEVALEAEDTLTHDGPCQCCGGSNADGHDDNCLVLRLRAAMLKAGIDTSSTLART